MHKNQYGKISGMLITGIALVSLLVAVVVVIASSYISAHNYGNSMERQLEAVKENNLNIFAQYGQKVQEIAQVPAMARDDAIKVVTAALEGRYGEDGSKATWQWLQEQNPSLSPELYSKIQQVIESGRNDFQNGQTRLIDAKRSYETALGTFWQGLWLRIVGYPKINLAEFKVISTDRANMVFEQGKETDIIKLR